MKNKQYFYKKDENGNKVTNSISFDTFFNYKESGTVTKTEE